MLADITYDYRLIAGYEKFLIIAYFIALMDILRSKNYECIMLESVVINPKEEHQATIIWLHGLGADGHDFEGVVPELRLPDHLGIKFIFPHAPYRSITINDGMSMRGWYDVKALDMSAEEDTNGINDSAQKISEIIDHEIAEGIPSTAIILAGFSQGGAIVLYTALRYRQPLLGVIALSTYLPLAERLSAEANVANQSTPIMLAHGQYDQVIDIQYGKITLNILKSLAYEISWHEYAMQHGVCAEELVDISDCIKKYTAIFLKG